MKDRDAAAQIQRLLRERIVILDGPMGTMIQPLKLDEAAFRGHLINDVLNLTQPEIIKDIHRQYFEAGADIVETNTFNSNALSMSEYKAEFLVYDLNVAGARLAREVADEFMAKDSSRPRFVAGSVGPTTRTASFLPDANRPEHRTTTYETLVEVFYEQARGLVDGGVDFLLAETIIDALNAKAALFAFDKLQKDIGRRIPVMASFTIIDDNGRLLSGETIEVFWSSVAHANLLSIGINCSPGSRQMRPFIEELAGLATVYISCYPNAGLPNALGTYDETAEETAEIVKEFARNGWVNIVGGCCGTTPAHIRVITESVAGIKPRIPPAPELRMR